MLPGGHGESIEALVELQAIALEPVEEVAGELGLPCTYNARMYCFVDCLEQTSLRYKACPPACC